MVSLDRTGLLPASFASLSDIDLPLPTYGLTICTDLARGGGAFQGFCTVFLT